MILSFFILSFHFLMAQEIPIPLGSSHLIPEYKVTQSGEVTAAIPAIIKANGGQDGFKRYSYFGKQKRGESYGDLFVKSGIQGVEKIIDWRNANGGKSIHSLVFQKGQIKSQFYCQKNEGFCLVLSQKICDLAFKATGQKNWKQVTGNLNNCSNFAALIAQGLATSEGIVLLNEFYSEHFNLLTGGSSDWIKEISKKNGQFNSKKINADQLSDQIKKAYTSLAFISESCQLY